MAVPALRALKPLIKACCTVKTLTAPRVRGKLYPDTLDNTTGN